MPRPRKSSTDSEEGRAGTHARPYSSATENYLLSLYMLWEDSEAPTVTRLTDALKQLPPSEELGTSVPSVAGMVRRMQKQGLVDIGPDKRVRLTKRGLEGGEDIARRHRLAEWLVVRLLGMDLHQAYIQAHLLEHGISRELEEKLSEKLKYPKRSPFGRPIPGTGQPNISANTCTLDKARPNVPYVVDRIPEEDDQLLQFLADSMIIPEHQVTVMEAAQFLGVVMVATGASQVSIGYSVAQQILVRPLEDEATGQTSSENGTG